MPVWKPVTFAVVLLLAATSARAQTALLVREAELAVPFGAAKGQLALLERQIVFVATDDASASLAIDRADIATLTRSDDVVTITTRQPLRDARGARDTFRFRVSQPAGLVEWYEAAPSSAASARTPAPVTAGGPGVLASYRVRHDHVIGSCTGTLVLTPERVAFESVDEIEDSRQWMLTDLKEVEQRGAYKLQIAPYTGDKFNFELLGKGMDSGEYRRLVERLARARAVR